MITVGTKGVFEAIDPFTIPNEMQTVTAVSSLQDLLNVGIDVPGEIYAPIGIENEEYENELIANPVIITLKNNAGEVIRIPMLSIKNVGIFEGIPYVDKAIVIHIGSHSETREFNGLMQQLVTSAEETIGVKCTAVTKIISKPKHVPTKEHIKLLTERAKRSSRETPALEMLRRKDLLIELLEEQLHGASKFIKEYLENCTDHELCCDKEGVVPDDQANVENNDVVCEMNESELRVELGSRCIGTFPIIPNSNMVATARPKED